MAELITPLSFSARRIGADAEVRGSIPPHRPSFFLANFQYLSCLRSSLGLLPIFVVLLDLVWIYPSFLREKNKSNRYLSFVFTSIANDSNKKNLSRHSLQYEEITYFVHFNQKLLRCLNKYIKKICFHDV